MNTDSSAPTTIDDYIARFPPSVQAILQQIRQTIHEAAPEATEKISYQMPTFYFHGNLVHFAAFRQHIGFYPTPTGIDAFEQELAAYKGGKGSLQFLLDRPIPYDLIRRITLFRVRETMTKQATARTAKKQEEGLRRRKRAEDAGR